jgi:hypothetical protein
MVCISSNNARHPVPETFALLKTFTPLLHHTSLGYILILSFPSGPRYSSWTSSFATFNDILNAVLPLPCALHGRSSHPSNNVRRVQTQMIGITQLSSSSCFFFPCRAKFAHQPSGLTYPQRRFPSAGV